MVESPSPTKVNNRISNFPLEDEKNEKPQQSLHSRKYLTEGANRKKWQLFVRRFRHPNQALYSYRWAIQLLLLLLFLLFY